MACCLLDAKAFLQLNNTVLLTQLHISNFTDYQSNKIIMKMLDFSSKKLWIITSTVMNRPVCWGFQVGISYFVCFPGCVFVTNMNLSFGGQFAQVCLTIQCYIIVCHKSFINTLRPRQNGRHFADDIFECTFLNGNVWIPIKISLQFVPKGPINNIPALVQIILGAVQATSHYLNQWWLVY